MDATSPAPLLGERFDRAVTYTLEAHRAQTRTSGVPYVAHLFAVCALVLECEGTESEAIAALLRDAAEDHGGRAQLARLEERFGTDVAAIVAGCSDSFEADPAARKAPFYDRKSAYLANLDRAGGPGDAILLVSAADTWSDANATCEAYRAGRPVFEQLTGKKFGTLWYYRAFADAARERDGRHVRFADRLIVLVDEMAGKPVTAQALLAAFAVDDSVDRREKGRLLEEGARL